MTNLYVNVSGGADSTACAILLKERGVEFEPVFADTGAELPETYWTLGRLQEWLGQKITVVTNRSFFGLLIEWGFFLPSGRQRWCTSSLKIFPLNMYQGEDCEVVVGIRADEKHRMRPDNKPKQVYPLVEKQMGKSDVIELCKSRGLLNPCYEWRSSCSCFCCPFQRKGDWRGLLAKHPDLYALAEEWESRSAANSKNSKGQWNERFSLTALRKADAEQLKMFPECEDEPCVICEK